MILALCEKQGWTERWKEERKRKRERDDGAKNVQGGNEMQRGEGQRGGEMQFFRSALFPATGEPPVLVSATFKFVPLSALFAEKCLFNFVYRHCKIFTRSLLLEQFSHHRTMGIGRRRETTKTERERIRSGKFTICIRPHFPVLPGELHHEDIKNRCSVCKKNLHIFESMMSQVALMFKVMFEIYRAIEIWRQIVGIVR